MRTLYEQYYKYMGKHDVENPFRGFFFHGKTYNKRPPFEDDWVRRKILVPGLFDKMRLELRVIIYVLIETGARISEICNLKPEDIRLDAEVPHIVIRPDRQKEVKAEKSERIIPLVGVALAQQNCLRGLNWAGIWTPLWRRSTIPMILLKKAGCMLRKASEGFLGKGNDGLYFQNSCWSSHFPTC